ncbi:MAG: beta-L-arabinofuranosidase domain-containing protein [Janthinobacterium lividum]
MLTLARYVLPLVAVVLLPRSPRQPLPAPVPPLEAFRPGALHALPLGSVQPQGWLRRQLQLQADGLSGHLEEFWPDLGPTSAWLGGSGEGWERGPYYLDGLVPLAYGLDDAALKAKAQKWVDWALHSQRPAGGFGPAKNQDWWPNMLVLKALMQYQEATNDPRVVPFMTRYFAYQSSQLAQRPLHEWAVYRWAEELLPIRWLYERTHNPRLLTLAGQLARQGFDWQQAYAHFQFTQPTSSASLGLASGNNDLALQAHGVNNAMALKMPALWGFTGGTQANRQAIYNQLKMLDTYHGLPNGMFSGDEHLAGRNPSQGVELCTVVEAQFSYEELLALLGDPQFGDRLEKITFNALPATFDPTMWAHQYDQQPNQVLVSRAHRQWSTNGDESNLFGLEPHFGCCTANMHQGWPKFAASLWLASPEGGLVAAAYAPNRLSISLEAGGGAVVIREETDYPFRETVRFTVEKGGKQAFALKLRIPAWATGSTVAVNGKAATSAPQPGTFYTLQRRWKAGDVVELRLPMQVRVVPGYNKSVSVERGPLVYGLKLGEEWTKLRDRPSLADDYQVQATTPWNYGLLLPTGQDPASVFKIKELPLSGVLFSPTGAPVELQVPGIRLPQWQLVENSAGPPPASPVGVPAGAPTELLTLIPYGATKLRITAFPLVQQQP